MKKIWGGRFESKGDELFERFNASFPFDYRLLSADILCSQAYAQGLEKAGIFTKEESLLVIAALGDLESSLRADPGSLTKNLSSYEDVHSFVEAMLVEKVGDVGKKLHTGRSRNDQVATDTRFFLREKLDKIFQQLESLVKVLLKLCHRHSKVIFPGYTHLQKAQPILFSHYLLSFGEMFLRDRDRIEQLRERVNQLPLGSGAIAGNNYSLDRKFLAEKLGFSGICANSLDASSDRDYIVEFMGASSLIMIHLSRLSEDLILYNTDEFKFIEMGDQVSTGSSLMPQKKNPDALELIRGKTGRVVGNQVALMVTLKGLPSCYNKDLQEDKEALFDTIDTLTDSLAVMELVLDTLKINEQKMQTAAENSFLNATDLADYLVGKGIPFRDCHEIIGNLVRHCIETKCYLHELNLEQLQDFSPVIQADVFNAIAVKTVVAAKVTTGGTAPFAVAEQIQGMVDRLT